MIRFFIERSMKYRAGLQNKQLETVDIDVPELEAILRGGGIDLYEYDHRRLVGCEVIVQEPKRKTVDVDTILEEWDKEEEG